MKNRWTALCLAALMALSACISCGSNKTDTTTTEASSSGIVPADQTTESGESKATEASTGSGEASSDASSATVPETSSYEFTPEEYSLGYTDEGFIEGVRALDYVKLPDFSSIEIKESEIVPTDENIEQTINYFLTYYAPDRESEVKDGDTVNIDYVGYIDGKAFENGSTEGNGTIVTIGVTSYIDDFLEQLIGHKPGDNFDVEVTFPDEYPNSPDLAGKDATFNTTINFIVPKISEEVIAKNQQTVDEYFGEGIKTPEDLKERLVEYYTDTNFETKIQEILQDAMDSFDAPEAAVKLAENQMDINTKLNYGMSLKSFGAYYGYSETDLQTMVEDNAKGIMIYQAIAEQEGWKFGEAELKEEFGDSYDAYLEKHGKGYIAEYMMYLHAWNYIEENVKLVNEEATE